MTESRIQLWRAVIAMARADRNITPSEMEYIENMLSNLKLDDSQKEMLRGEIHNGPPISEITPLITDDRDRGILVHFARLVSAADGDICVDEKELLSRLSMEAMVDENLLEIKKSNEAIARIQDENLKNSPKFFIVRALEYFFGRDTFYE